jgi:hypothetical protein
VRARGRRDGARPHRRPRCRCHRRASAACGRPERGRPERVDQPTPAALRDRATADPSRPWPVPPAGDFARFRRDGNRTEYQSAVFARDKRLSRAAVMAAVTLEPGWIEEVVDGVSLLCEQSTWCRPAHDGVDRPPARRPARRARPGPSGPDPARGRHQGTDTIRHAPRLAPARPARRRAQLDGVDPRQPARRRPGADGRGQGRGPAGRPRSRGRGTLRGLRPARRRHRRGLRLLVARTPRVLAKGWPSAQARSAAIVGVPDHQWETSPTN